jgi:hypothetical protein
MIYSKPRCSECAHVLKQAGPLADKEPEGYLYGNERPSNFYSCMNEDCDYYNQQIEITE